jgi:hypothetical protein
MPKRRIRSALDETPDDIIYNALSDDEMDACRNVIMFGPEWLRSTKRWNGEKIKRFLDRSEIKRELDMLRRQYEDREGIQERTQYFAQLRINGMIQPAIGVLARALRGEYTDPATGKTMAPPTAQQLDAAKEVLSRANIQGGKYAGNDAVPSIDARSIQIAIGSQVDSGLLDAKGRAKVMEVLNAVTNRTRALATHQRRREVVAEQEDPDDG